MIYIRTYKLNMTNLISDEAIIETFEVNEYLFNEETLRIESV